MTKDDEIAEVSAAKFPSPEFNIGDIVRVRSNDDSDEIAMVVGIRLRYYLHLRRHVYYYELADKTSSPTVTFADWLSAEEVSPTSAKTEAQKWHVTGGEIPIRKMVICSFCKSLRVDDYMDCPYCSAERE